MRGVYSALFSPVKPLPCYTPPVNRTAFIFTVLCLCYEAPLIEPLPAEARHLKVYSPYALDKGKAER